MADYGSGLTLDENFDFQVDETGDLRGESDIAELHKDLAFNVVRALKYGEGIDTPETVADGGVVGEPLTDGVLSDIELAVGKVVNDDDRITAVLRIEAEIPEDTENNYVQVDCQAQIDVVTEQFEFVVPAS